MNETKRKADVVSFFVISIGEFNTWVSNKKKSHNDCRFVKKRGSHCRQIKRWIIHYYHSIKQ